MKLLSLRMDGFGKFRDVRLDFEEGFNVLYGLNESGKSTVHAFIEGMFYGFLDPMKKRRIYLPAHERYRPRDSAPYKGALVFEKDDKRYRIERNFDKDHPDVRLLNETTGKDIGDTLPYDSHRKQIDLAAFIDMPYNLYKDSLSIAELSAETGDASADDLFRRLQSLNATKTETMSVSKAKDYLDALDKDIGSTRGQKQPYPKALKQKERLEEEKKNTMKHHEEILTTQNALEEKKKELDTLQSQKKTLEKTLAKQENTKKLQKLEKVEAEEHRVRRLLEEHSTESIDVDAPFLEKAREDYPALWDDVASDADDYRELHLSRKNLRANYPKESERLDEATYEQIQKDHERFKEAEEARQTQTEVLKNEIDRLQADVISLEEKKRSRQKRLPFLGGALALALAALIFVSIIQTTLLIFVFSVLALLCTVGALWAWRTSNKLSKQLEAFAQEQTEKNKNLAQQETKIEAAEKTIGELIETYKVSNQEELLSTFYSARQKLENHQRAVEYDEKIQNHESSMEKILEKYRALLRRFKLQEDETGLKTLKAIRESIRDIERHLDGIPYKTFTADLDQDAKVSLEDYEDNVEALKELEDSISKKHQEVVKQETALNHEKAQSRPLSTIEYELQKTEEKISAYEKEKHDIAAAKKLLDEASEAIEETFSPILRKNIERYLPDLTGQTYADIRVRKDLTFRAEHPLTKQFEETTFFSKGTLDQMYLAIRLGVLKTLKKEDYPLFLDDAFVNFDDERLRDALALFDTLKDNHQILLFTCHTREAERLEELNIKFHHQELK